jgi:hypothetical protein
MRVLRMVRGDIGVRLLLVAFLSALVLLVPSARAETPIHRIAGAIVTDSELAAQNTRLKKRIARLVPKLGRRERQVRRLKRANRRAVELGSSGVVRGFLCIHEYEGAWNDSGAPYWGGLQMDDSFMRSYGGEFYRALGPASLWPPFVQVVVAMRAYYSGRGFHPWPRTAHYCGLL